VNGERASGILLHPTSLPAETLPDGSALDIGSGDFGSAPRFLEWLDEAGQSLWQVLPLNPVGPSNSPYTSVSAHAGNPWLISPTRLWEEGWLHNDDLAVVRQTPVSGAPTDPRADFDRSKYVRGAWLRTAAGRFFTSATATEREPFAAWCDVQRAWLDDYALFMALRDRYGATVSWTQWPPDVAHRDPAAIAKARHEIRGDVDYWRFVQWCFDRQWTVLRAAARARGIRIIGDMPIYVALDSADVWAAPDMFDLDEAYAPRAVAGVPPDYFSATGQLWGNPLYRWDRHAEDGYAWWSARMRSALRHADIVRIDHFRGFASYWEVPATAATAVEGRWLEGPGKSLFTALESELGTGVGALPVIAEDLGLLTPDVPALIAAAGVPCMRVVQFGFGDGDDNLNLPHNFPEACAAFTGTHDNDTAVGWFSGAPSRVRDHVKRYLRTDARDIGRDLIHAVSMSIARYAISPFQDVLGLGSEARMNVPGVAERQWSWRFGWDDDANERASWLREITTTNRRAPRRRPC
jgi:4-alpha-glucanotransferase